MKKREFIKLTGIFGAGMVVAPLAACHSGGNSGETAASQGPAAFELEPLPFALDALEPAIDAMTMEIHHGKHHAAYVKNLNAALENANRFWGKSLEEIMAELTEDDTAIRNNGGGHYNHRLFWELLTPGGAKRPTGDLAAAIDKGFGSYEGFEKEFTDSAKSRFGSGWAWLCQGPSGLFVCSTSNQDNPLMTGIAEMPGIPIMGIDVWEHAYYLNYQNRRPDYVSAFMGLINWDVVAAKFAG